MLAGLAAGMLGTTYIEKKNNAEIVRDITRHLSPSDIQHSSTFSMEVCDLEKSNSYIHRPALEDKITSILHRETPSKQYFVVYGPKGVGKSVLVAKCVDGKKGVVKVLISSVFEKSGILQVLSTKLMGEGSKAVSQEEMVNALMNAKVEGRLPTLIFEIEHGEGAEQKACVNSVRSLCKQFAVYSNCIIILSETNAALVFGQDIDREEMIFVPELTRDEAMEFVRARRKDVDMIEKDVIRLFDNVGTTAATLEYFLNGSMSVDEFIAVRMVVAKRNLVEFPFQPILKALKEHPEGVPPAYFNKEKCEGVNMSSPVAVGAGMKAAQSNVVFFDFSANVYRLNSHALEVALRSYEPVVLPVAAAPSASSWWWR